MTDTTTPAPTDAEILDAAEDFRSQHTHGGTTFYEFDEIGFARAVRAKWGAQPVAVPAAGPVGFDHKTAANFLNGKTVADEEMRRFVACSRWAHDDRDGLRSTVSDMRREIAQRDAEIALLKISLLAAEQPAPARGAGIIAQAVPAPGEPSEAPTQAQVDERSDTVWLFIRLGQKNIRRAITLLEIDSMRAPELAFGPLLLKAIAELRKT